MPSSGAWIGSPQPWASRVGTPSRSARRPPAGWYRPPGSGSNRMRSNAYRWPSMSVPWLGIRVAGVWTAIHSPLSGNSTTRAPSSSAWIPFDAMPDSIRCACAHIGHQYRHGRQVVAVTATMRGAQRDLNGGLVPR